MPLDQMQDASQLTSQDQSAAAQSARGSSSTAVKNSRSAVRLDTVFLTQEECNMREECAESTKRRLASKSATERKFELLNVSLEDKENDSGTRFIIVDMNVLQALFIETKCAQCNHSGLDFDREEDAYGLAYKLLLTCSACGYRKEAFSSPRVQGENNITPFEVNVRAVKAIQGIGKGTTALSDFCAGMNLAKHGMHHKTFQGHLAKLVEAYEDVALESETKSVEVIKEMYKDFLNPVGNIDVMYDGTWMTRGRSSHIGVGCIIELYTGLVIDHVLSNFCLGCAVGPKPNEEAYTDWLSSHECQKNIDCNSGRMEVEAALIMFRRSLAKHGLRYTAVLSDGDSRTYHALQEESVYGFVEIEKKDCLNHVHKRMGTALRNLVDKKKAMGQSLGGKGKLTQSVIKKSNKLLWIRPSEP